MIDNPANTQKEIEDVRKLMAEGVAHHQAGKIASAKRRYRDVLRIDPDEADALHFMGIISHQEGRNREAITYLLRAVKARPDFLPALQNLSKVQLGEELYEDALKTAEQVLAIDENAHHALRTMAHAYQELHQFEEAYRAYSRIDELFPNEVGTIRNLALSLGALRRREEAVAAYRRALEVEPDNVITRVGLATALNATGAFDDAIAELDLILARKPDYLPAIIQKGMALDGKGDFDAATALFRHALTIDPGHPEAHFNLGLALLSSGDLGNGWKEYAWRLKTQAFIKQKPPTTAPMWQGEDLAGKSILLFPEQGMGDSIQFVRYAEPVGKLAEAVHICCHRPLLELLRTVDGAVGVSLLGDDLPPVDYQISMMELPHLLGTESDTIPAADGYLKPPGVDFRRPDNLSVGLVWQGNPSHQRDVLRSIPLRELAPLFELGDVSFFSLQVGVGREQIGECGFGDRIEDLSDRLTNFSVTAGFINKLDLVISVDTSVAHVAGAIGKPLWLLVPTSPDWRWCRTGETTPWYSSMRLFRQESPGAWPGVVERVRSSLLERAEQQGH